MMGYSRLLSLALVIATAGAITSGCKSLDLPTSYGPVGTEGSQQTDSVAVEAKRLCIEARAAEGSNATADHVGTAIQCARTLASAYLDVADDEAKRRQGFHYAEIGFSALTLGLAGFEAHSDTLKAAGLAAGTTTVFRSSQQYAARIAAVQKASTRLQCVVEHGRIAQTSQRLVQLFRDSQRESAPRLDFAMLPLLNTQGNDERLLSVIIDAISSIEQSAQSEYRFREQTESPSDAISQAVDQALALGKSASEQTGLAMGLKGEGFERLRQRLLITLDQATKFEESLLKITACASI